MNEFNANAATSLTCTGAGSACVVNGFNVANQSTGAAASITQNGLNVQATGVAAGALNGLNISAITGGAGAETAINIGSGWDNVLSVNGVAILNSTGVLQNAAWAQVLAWPTPTFDAQVGAFNQWFHNLLWHHSYRQHY